LDPRIKRARAGKRGLFHLGSLLIVVKETLTPEANYFQRLNPLGSPLSSLISIVDAIPIGHKTTRDMAFFYGRFL
jgi:hypothetical protein